MCSEEREEWAGWGTKRRAGGGRSGWRGEWATQQTKTTAFCKLPDSEALDLAEQLGLVLEKFEGEDGEVDALANALAEAAVSTEGGAKLVGVGLERFFGARFITPEKILFHEIFYFHHLDDLIRVFHPSPLEAIQTALLSPHTYLGCACCCFSPNASFNNNNNPSHLLPDTTILFLRYLESGKLINLYDWFESFASVLEAVENRNEIEEGGGEKGKKKRKKAEEGGQLVGGGREEAQARFMRAFHELDFLGLLKGTKRREDCCLKTLFRLPEEEEEED
ncbi:hypothetical protein BDY24DRAFT_223335 [Mrakia frigida]|uniref:uncharacterized protein n=1 Tax=Mrakia frigida TaxID=29902 RepID=UPI003FCBF4CB